METFHFIPQDPNKPRYSRRIPDLGWEAQKSFLEQLHNRGLTREQMVSELATRRNFHVSKNRLDNRMKAWGFSRYKHPSSDPQSSDGGAVHTAAASAVAREEVEARMHPAHPLGDDKAGRVQQHQILTLPIAGKASAKEITMARSQAADMFPQDLANGPLPATETQTAQQPTTRKVPPPSVAICVISTHSPPHPSESFEEAVTRLSEIPDDEDGGLEATLMKLQSQFPGRASSELDESFDEAVARFSEIPDDGDGGLEATLIKLQSQFPERASSELDDPSLPQMVQHHSVGSSRDGIQDYDPEQMTIDTTERGHPRKSEELPRASPSLLAKQTELSDNTADKMSATGFGAGYVTFAGQTPNISGPDAPVSDVFELPPAQVHPRVTADSLAPGNYICSDRMLALHRKTSKQPGFNVISSQQVLAFKEAGAVLYTLKAYEMAFEFYFLVWQHFTTMAQDIIPDLVIAIVNCARCAYTLPQRSVAQQGLNALLLWAASIEQGNQAWLKMTRPFWRYVCSLPGYDVQLGIVSYRGLKSSRFSIIDPAIDGDNVSLALSWTATDRYKVIDHMKSCPTTRTSLLDALRKFTGFVQWETKLIDAVVEHFWGLGRGDAHRAARVLSCLLLHCYAHTPLVTTVSNTTGSDHTLCGMPCAWEEMAMLVWPFIVMDDVHRNYRSSDAPPSQLLLSSAANYQHAATIGTYGFLELMEERRRSTFGSGFSIVSTVCHAQVDWVFDVASAAAKLNATPDFSWLGELLPSDSIISHNTLPVYVDYRTSKSASLMDLTLSAAMRTWSMSDTSSMRSFRKFSERINPLILERNTQHRSSDAMSLDSRASNRSSLFSRLSGSASRSSRRKSPLSSVHEPRTEVTRVEPAPNVMVEGFDGGLSLTRTLPLGF
ncbi:hypothetical protein A1O7_09596 [Cladophialophora yegresii CBS 114405]|uniref:Clr5 domain-containing protein n=1 Tax=Cladophialophora yegresii CBS 114405 TaxID=1182544 RepID=W9W6T7_9EURO|nr:uncharacterized protein A1O7_09596 [Cladophialophora yegresii CBS 114405]EXJ54259.1 hypothetical protein A1O7_09596 [Cladophialophora yegresii CBS 114405]